MRIGLVGYGLGGRFFHAPFIVSTLGCSLVGIVTRSAQRRAEVEQDHPGTPVFDSLAALVAAGVDAVVISTPATVRPAQVRECIELGVPVLSDKPFALDEAQAQDLVARAEGAGVPLCVYQNRRWDSEFLTVQKLLSSGSLGDVHRFESRIEGWQSEDQGKATGGGALRDIGSHQLDQALLLFGPVKSIYAEMTYVDQVLDCDYFVSLEHHNGVRSHLWGSAIQHSPGPRFRVNGSLGCYRIEHLDAQAYALFDGHTPKTLGERWGAEDHLKWGWLQRGEERELLPSEYGQWPAFYRQWVAALKGERAMPVLMTQVLSTQRLLDAARQSAASGQVLTLE